MSEHRQHSYGKENSRGFKKTKYIRIVLILAAAILVGPAWGQTCLQNGGTNTNCVEPTQELWEGLAFDGTNIKTVLYKGKSSAIQGTAKAFIDNRKINYGEDYYNMGVQWSSFNYQAWSSCSSPVNLTDSTYTDPNNLVASGATYIVNIHVHGTRPHPSCASTNPASYQYASASGTPLYIKSVIGCPRGYYAVDEKKTGFIRSTTYPYDHMCAGPYSSSLESTTPLNDQVPDCQTAPTRGCTTTQDPVLLSNGLKREHSDDLVVAGPWPLRWTRIATNQSFKSSWIMPGNVALKRGRRTSGTFSGKDVISITRRNGSILVFTSIPGTGVQTWQMGVNAHRNTAHLEEIWSSGNLVGYSLARRDGVTEIFTSNGTLVRETNPSGHNHHYSWDSSGNLLAISDDFGSQITVIRDEEQGWEDYPWEDPDWDPTANNNDGGIVLPPDGEGIARYTTDIEGTTRYSRIVAVSDGSREVLYDWGQTSTAPSTNVDILKQVQTPSGNSWTYVYGESVDGYNPGAKWITGVIGPDSNRWLTYKRGSDGVVWAEWKGVGPTTSGALERINRSSSWVTDGDGRTFSTYSSNGEQITSQTSPWPSDWLGGGAGAKTLVYEGTSTAPSGTLNSGYKAGELLSETDWRNTTTTYTYDTVGRMTSKTQTSNIPAPARTTTWTYSTNPGHREPLTETSTVIVGGNSYTRTWTWTYTDITAAYPAASPCHSVPTGQPQCATTRRVMTSATVSTTVPGEVSRTTTMTYNSYGLLETQTDAAGVVMRMTYDAKGLPASKTIGYGTSLAKTTTFGGESPFGPLYSVDPNGLVTRWSYDGEGNVIQVQTGTPGSGEIGTPSGGGGNPYTGTGTWNSADGGQWRSTSYTYDGYGRPTLAVDSSGLKTVMTYNGAGRVIQIQRQTSSGTPIWTLEYTRSNAGLITQQTLREGGASGTVVQQSSQTYSSTRFLASSLDAYSEATSFGYDANGNPGSTTSPLGHTQGTTYDLLNRPVELTNALSGITQLGWDIDDNLIEVVDPSGGTTVYEYNGFGDVVEISSPDSGTTVLSYSNDGRLESRQDARGVVVSYDYDDLGRVVSEVFDDSGVNTSTWGAASTGFVSGTQSRINTYDGCGGGLAEICSVSEPAGTTSYTYNAWGDMLSRSWTGKTGTPAAGLTLTTSYTYLADGRLSQMSYPSGKILIVSYGNDGRPESLEFDGATLLDNITWTGTDSIEGWEWGLAGLPSGKAYVSVSHDANALPNGYEDVSQRQIVRDDDRRVVGVDDVLDVSRSRLFGWDGNNRLTSSDVGAWSSPLAYTWNANTNMTGKTDTVANNGLGWTYGTNTNQLSTAFSVIGGAPGSGTAVPHDPAGSLTSDGLGRSFAYDSMNRLTKTTSGAVITTYGYAGMVRRTAATSSQVRLYEVDEAGRRLGEYVKDASQPAGWRPVQEFVYLDNWRIVGVVDYAPGGGSSLMAVLSDPITGTPRQVMDSSGDIRWDWDSKEAFGNQAPDQAPTSGKAALVFDARFPGQWYDQASGLFHNNWRDYWARAGRYTQVDPIGLAGGANPYAYAGGNPVEAVDPLGLQQYPRSVQQAQCLATTQQSKYLMTIFRPDGRPWGYGCGDRKTDIIVPDMYPKSCRKHDECYGSQNGKDFCDSQFLDDMIKEKPGRGAISYIYYKAVKRLGYDAYDSAGKENEP